MNIDDKIEKYLNEGNHQFKKHDDVKVNYGRMKGKYGIIKDIKDDEAYVVFGVKSVNVKPTDDEYWVKIKYLLSK